LALYSFTPLGGVESVKVGKAGQISNQFIKDLKAIDEFNRHVGNL